MNTDTTSVQDAEKELEKSQNCPFAVIKRKDGQEYSDFKKLQADVNKQIRHFIKGLLFHDSSTGTFDVGSSKSKSSRYKAHKALTHLRKTQKRKKI